MWAFLMMNLTLLDANALAFPSPHFALDEPDGLLAVGGDLSVPRLLKAYQNGIFPWFSDGDPYMWWSPKVRAVIAPSDFAPAKSLRKWQRKHPSTIRVNHHFDEVIHQCARIPRSDGGTWITEEMQTAYKALHKAGAAHSIEVYQDDELVGGLYGVLVGRVFCGESMFHKTTNASKIAFWALNQLLSPFEHTLIDCQMMTPHLESLGVAPIKRGAFLKALAVRQNALTPCPFTTNKLVSLTL